MTDFYKIIEYDEYGLAESVSLVKARFFEIENGFVGIWTERNRNQDPDISVNVKDVLTITPIEGEEK